MKRMTTILAVLLLVGCTDEVGARRALRGAGYTSIELTGFAWTGCGGGDDQATGFRAKGPTGVHVEGVVCSSWSKGSTIRTF